MKMLVHTGTGTFFGVDDDVYVIDTDDLSDEDLEAFIEGWDSNIRRICERSGKVITSNDL